MTGRELRGKVDAFPDILIDIEAFLQEKGELDFEIKDIIDRMKVDCENLFYLIPLEEE